MDLTTLRNVKTLLEAFLSVTESKTIPAVTPFTVTVDNATTYEVYGSVVFTATGAALTRVTGAPAAGQYAVANGVYTFNSADAGKGVRIAYTYTPTDAWQTSWTDLVSDMISGVSLAAEKYCNRKFERVERTEYHNGGGQYLFLRALPVDSITSIKNDLDWDWAGATALDTSEYALNTETGMVKFIGGTWLYGAGCVQVVYIGGYDVDPGDGAAPTGYVAIPGDLEQAVCRQVAYDFNRRKDIGLESVSLPDGSIQKTNSGEFLPSVKSVLDRYRLRSVG